MWEIEGIAMALNLGYTRDVLLIAPATQDLETVLSHRSKAVARVTSYPHCCITLSKVQFMNIQQH